MIIHRDIQQGTPEWAAVRVGVITASGLDNIVTPKTMVASASAWPYMDKMCAELAYGHPLDNFQSDAMEAGSLNENESLDNYCFQNNCEVEKVGFVTNDAGTIGCSPDALVVSSIPGGWSHGVEAKNPKPETHSGYLRDPNLLTKKYWCQVQGCLWVCELDKWDLFSYDSKQRFVQQEIGRDEKFIKLAAQLCAEFLEKFAAEKAKRGLPDRIALNG